ncbi:MAG: demethylmenaquinone methyltransferase/2-methoxy-6-polyprenyl-1,4-benzoquinol methylase [Myxococcota bacterium]|jgi:demethylmenaquinone methyltransferase/2-methoxy-6-polyprenyl-1,4-benzoquinol methylase
MTPAERTPHLPATRDNRDNRLGGGAMFDRIAQRYDRLNTIMSFGMHGRWRRALIRAIGPLEPGASVLDLASGTADVAIAVAKRYPLTQVVGLDPSAGMLDVGQQKLDKAGLSHVVKLVVGDAQALPFRDNAFAATTISFGIRNVPDRARALREMARVTRPGGKVAVLELSVPRGGLLSPFARMHVRHIVPRLGAWLSGDREYRYLQESIAAFPTPDAFAAMMGNASLRVDGTQRFAFGGAHLYVATAKPQAEP